MKIDRFKIINFCIYAAIASGILYVGFWQGSFQTTIEHFMIGY